MTVKSKARVNGSVENGKIEVIGARVHNLKNINVGFPRNQLVVITGLSGSGKSSLAFDTIYAEGQRRYMETFSSYSRQFMGGMERPDVDKISGLSPVIAIEQKTTSKNPRSTVGTITEIYDFLRLLFARTGEAKSYITGKIMEKLSEDQVVAQILQQYQGQAIHILAPLIKGRKGHYRELFEQIRKQGFTKVRVDGVVMDLEPKMTVDRYKIHDIEVVVDRLVVQEKDKTRLYQAVMQAMKISKGIIKITNQENQEFFFSRFLMDVESGISYDEPQPNSFSFNSPYGACPDCNGLGFILEADPDLVFPDKKLSLQKGALAPLGSYKESYFFSVIEAYLKVFDLNVNDPISKYSPEALEGFFNGLSEPISLEGSSLWRTRKPTFEYPGFFAFLQSIFDEIGTASVNLEDYSRKVHCPSCQGARLKKESLHFYIADKNIFQLSSMDIAQLYQWFQDVEPKLTEKQKLIGAEIFKEIKARLGFLLDVGLSYLSLNRPSGSLSGGESQRIRLATQIGSQLVNVLYILDEPSIGLHQRDNERLINSLKNLRDIGNSVLVVEHDKDMILEADYVIDMGPAAGRLGGRVVAEGTPESILKSTSLTSQYLNGTQNIEIPESRRKGSGESLVLEGASGNNLKNVSVKIPLGMLVLVTGVSGSGKSTLITETLYPILNHHFFRAKKKPMPYTNIHGLNHVDKVIEIDQSPIGRTPRSNPATYTGVFSDIRALFVQLPESKIRGYKPGRFSFNVKGGRCETCQGAGLKVIEMNFLPDVQVSCEECQGKRYNRETLEVRYKGKSISDVLDMSIDEAVPFFESLPSIYRKIKTLQDVGLGYITLGQSSVTLSGGEAQRVKLATELSKKDTGNTLYILDEPTTGLHFEDINVLLKVINRLVDRGNTVLIIEHNLDVIKVADWVIDLGPEGGLGGGQILFEGTPEQMVRTGIGDTARFLSMEMPERSK